MTKPNQFLKQVGNTFICKRMITLTLVKAMWLFFFIFCVNSFCSGQDEIQSSVVTLDSTNFSETIEKYELSMVEFYAKWCGHCKSFAPVYEAIAEKFKGNTNILIAKVDGDEEKDIAKEHDIEGFPTLKFCKNKKWYTYEKNRDADSIIDFIKEVAQKDWQPEPEAVLTLTDDNFNATIANGLVLVEFYAPWCGHCKNLAPKYRDAAKILARSDVILAKVDATQESTLAQRYNVSGYPTLIIFREGKRYEYNGPRNEANGIVEYMLKQRGDASQELTSKSDYKKFSNPEDVTIVGFFQDANDPQFLAYLEISNQLRDELRLLHTFDPALHEEFRAQFGTVAMYQPVKFRSKYESPRFLYPEDQELTMEGFKGFVAKWRRPLVGQMTKANRPTLYRTLPLCVAYYAVDWSHNYIKATQHWRSKILEVAKDHPDVTFAIASDEDFELELKKLKLDDNGEEVNVGCYTEKERFRMEPTELEVEDLRKFIEQFEAKKLDPVIWSQPVPARNPGPVITVVAETFDSIVNYDERHVLLEYYAPWCGHCKSLEPIYTKLAKKMQNSAPDLIVAKMDATANDVTLEIGGFPSIYFFPKGDKSNPVPFHGNRTLEGFTDFLEEQLSGKGKEIKEEL